MVSEYLNRIKPPIPSFAPWQPKNDSRQVAVMMSGGVDSSVTAAMLKQQGWQALGVTMKIPTCSAEPSSCCGADAALVCHQLEIPHYYLDVTEIFQQVIIDPFRRYYLSGKTPNPCIDCNTVLKFGIVWDFIKQHFGIEYLATGHYGSVEKGSDEFYLRRGRDENKDQSYFLYGINKNRLKNLILPLGDFKKSEIRDLAESFGLSVAQKPESMELCFAGNDDYRLALNQNDPGDILDTNGKIIGRHSGIGNYTLGQRRGIGISGKEPVYVCRINVDHNTITLGPKESICHSTIKAVNPNILIEKDFSCNSKLFGKIRSYGKPAACRIISIDEAGFSVRFQLAKFAPAPGQKIVLYNDQNRIVAGGEICDF